MSNSLAGAIILKVSYDYSIIHEDLDPLVDLAERALRTASIAGQPGTWLVDFFPMRTQVVLTDS